MGLDSINNATLYGVNETSYVFYMGPDYYWEFDRETNELIEQTRNIDDEKYIKIQNRGYSNRCYSFTLNEKEYAVALADPVGYSLEIESLDYHLTIDKDFLTHNAPDIMELFKDSSPILGNYFLYDNRLCFVYYENRDDNWGGKTFRFTVPQLVFCLNVEEKTIEYIGFSENDYDLRDYSYNYFGANYYCVVGVAKIK